MYVYFYVRLLFGVCDLSAIVKVFEIYCVVEVRRRTHHVTTELFFAHNNAINIIIIFIIVFLSPHLFSLQ